MGREVNIDSIPALDRRIKEITAELIRLKRSRNSLLKIAQLPPEILGRIFHLNAVPKFSGGHFPKLPRGSYNFLLVCHHWFQVARNTPELWSFWGNNLEDWKRRYPLSGASSPVDLVLDGTRYQVGSLDEALRDVLRDRAARDVVRKVHIMSYYTDSSTATAIISLLTPEDEGIRHSSIESISLIGVDVSNFFARHHFPKLRDLYLFNSLKVSSWDHLKPHTMALVNLTINFGGIIPPSVIPTTSQVLSLLASNPNIRSLMLEWPTVSDDGRNDSTCPVPLCHLERLTLMGNLHYVFPILHQLELPERLDNTVLHFDNCKLAEVYEIIGPYIRDYLQRDPRFKDRLGVFSSSNTNWFSLHACTISVEHHDPGVMPPRNPPHVRLEVDLPGGLSLKEQEGLFIDTLALAPQESVVRLQANLMVAEIEHVLVKMPNIEYLHLANITVRSRFLLPCSGVTIPYQKLLPSLRRLYLEDVRAEDEDWDPLITYLIHQTSGNQAVSLGVSGKGVHMCSDVLDKIYELVEELVYCPDPDKECPSNQCLT